MISEGGEREGHFDLMRSSSLSLFLLRVHSYSFHTRFKSIREIVSKSLSILFLPLSPSISFFFLSLSLSSFDFMCLFSLFIRIEVRRCRYIELSKSFSHSSLRLLSMQCAVRSAFLEEDRSLFLIDLDVKKHERKKDSQTIHLQS